MEQKKHKKVNLENKRGLYSAIGLMMASAIVLVALEYRTLISAETGYFPGNPFEEDDAVEMMPISFPDAPKKTKVPKEIKQQILTSLIDETGDEGDLEIQKIDIKVSNQNLLASNVSLLPVEIDTDDNLPFIIVEKMPEFKGGEANMYAYLKNNIEIPRMAMDAKVKGTVYIEFIIEKNGSVNKIKVLRDEAGAGCAEEAVRVVQNMPKWNPGSQMGKRVRVKLSLPIHFKVQ